MGLEAGAGFGLADDVERVVEVGEGEGAFEAGEAGFGGIAGEGRGGEEAVEYVK